MQFNDIIKQRVEIIQEVHHLHRGAVRRDGREAHDVREIDGHVIKDLRLDGRSSLQLLRNAPAQDTQVPPA